MTRWIEALVAHVEASGLGTQGVDLFAQDLLETDDDGPTAVLAIQPGTTTNTGGNRKVDAPGLLVGVRAASFAAAWDRCDAIRDLIRTIGGQTIQGQAFLGVVAASPLEDAGRDERSRRQIVCRFEVYL